MFLGCNACSNGCRLLQLPCLPTVVSSIPSHKTIVISLLSPPVPPNHFLASYHILLEQSRNLCKTVKLGEPEDHAECL